MNEDEIAAGLAPTPGYRYVDIAGDEMFVAGQVPLDGSGSLVGDGDHGAQARQCIDNLHRLTGVHGFWTADIRRLVVYVVGDQAGLTDAWNAVRASFDGSVPPATLLGVALLGYPGQLVEVDATVVKRSTVML